MNITSYALNEILLDRYCFLAGLTVAAVVGSAVAITYLDESMSFGHS